MSRITEQPAYQRFRKIYAERIKGIVAFVGSGLSAPANLPTWPELRRRLEDECAAKARTLEPDGQHALETRLLAIKKMPDHWIAFDRLASALGSATYHSVVRAALTPAPGVQTPALYSLLWGLRLDGMLTLNLDRFAARSFLEAGSHRTLNEMQGTEVGSRLQVLSRPNPFVVNLHGITEDSETWVMRKTERDRLLSDEGYRFAISTIFSTKTVLFAGISADDVGAGGRLEWLHSVRVDPGEHYWLTDRRDKHTDDWAEARGLQVIRYEATPSHEAALQDLFSDLRTFVSTDEEAPPVADEPPAAHKPLPDPDTLAGKSPETIRLALSSEAARILQTAPGDIGYAQYKEFCRRYDRAVYNSWYVSLSEPDNRLFGNELVELVGEGAFGTVYRAISPDQETVAVKILRQEIRERPDMLGSFRRGVRSMHILSDASIEGMVRYRSAYELPPCVVMDFVEGVNLEQAVLSKQLDQWRDSLRIANEIARIVRAGHLLPQRVLHRDIRPPNILLRDFWANGDKFEVVVVDFDLSWHKGATERSVAVQAGNALGYLAPEQLRNFSGVSTRSTAVDSFGLGMTLYFMLTREHPFANQILQAEWSERLRKRLNELPSPEWQSLPNRLGRLIERATRYNQPERIDMGEIQDELKQMEKALSDPSAIELSELWAEEVLCRAAPDPYKWDADELRGEVVLRSGVSIEVRGDEVTGNVCVNAVLMDAGVAERREIDKYFPVAREKCRAALAGAGWEVSAAPAGTRTLRVSAKMETQRIRRNPDRASEGIAALFRELHFR